MFKDKKSLLISSAVGVIAACSVAGLALAQSSVNSSSTGGQGYGTLDLDGDFDAATLSVDTQTTCNVGDNGIDLASCSTDVWQACGLTQPDANRVVELAFDDDMMWDDGPGDGDEDDHDDGRYGRDDDGFDDEEMLMELLSKGEFDTLLGEGFTAMFGFELSDDSKQKAEALLQQIEQEAIGQLMAETLGVPASEVDQFTFLERSSLNDGRDVMAVWGPGAMQDENAQPQMLMVPQTMRITFDVDCAPALDQSN